MKKNVSNTPAPTTPPSEVLITIDGQQYPIRFSLNVLRDWTKLSGHSPNEFGPALVNDYLEAFTGIIVCAVRRFVPALAEFTQDQAADALEEMEQEEADAIAKAITKATTSVNPLLAALSRQFAAKEKALAAEQEAANPVTPEFRLRGEELFAATREATYRQQVTGDESGPSDSALTVAE